MTDPNMQDFQGRIGRIDRIHRAGGGFEASGTLGMSYYNSHRPKRRRHALLGLVVVFMVVMIALKASMLVTLGDGLYLDRIKSLSHGGRTDQIGAFLLQPDRVSTWLAAWIRHILP